MLARRCCRAMPFRPWRCCDFLAVVVWGRAEVSCEAGRVGLTRKVGSWCGGVGWVEREKRPNEVSVRMEKRR